MSLQTGLYLQLHQTYCLQHAKDNNILPSLTASWNLHSTTLLREYLNSTTIAQYLQSTNDYIYANFSKQIYNPSVSYLQALHYGTSFQPSQPTPTAAYQHSATCSIYSLHYCYYYYCCCCWWQRVNTSTIVRRERQRKRNKYIQKYRWTIQIYACDLLYYLLLLNFHVLPTK